MGQRTVSVPLDGQVQTVTGRLMGRGGHKNEMLDGTITFRVVCSRDITTN